MLFNSAEYLFFFLAALIASWLTVGIPRLRVWVLMLASYYFYYSNNSWLIVLIVVSTLIDFVAGQRIADSKDQASRKWWLTASMVTNLGILGFFKYFNFFAGSVAEMIGAFGLSLSWTDLNIILPVGISFYTFQSMSYTIDVYRQRIPVERSLLNFAFYISYFPQLIAGPIVRADLFLPQVGQRPTLDVDALEDALQRIFIGLFKKIILADFLARYVDTVYGAPADATSIQAWLAVYAFTLQIYFDFSGYTDIAIGCARLMGFRLPENFDRPYAAPSFSDFWRRWHMTLSLWLRDYLYIPLGGSRMPTPWGNYRNLMITMGLCGLWHGAGWNFVVWGVMHGIILCIERATGLARATEKDASLLRIFLYFNAAALSWIPFRAESLADIGTVLRSMFVFTGGPVTYGMAAAGLIVFVCWLSQVLSLRTRYAQRFLALPLPVKGVAYGLVWVLVMIFNSKGATPFIYFQF